MKSAWMLAAFSSLVAGLGGCFQPGLSLSPPASRPQAVPQALAPQPAAPAPGPSVTPAADTGGAAEAGNDPAVSALTQKIEALAGQAPGSPVATQPAALAVTTPVAATPVAAAPVTPPAVAAATVAASAQPVMGNPAAPAVAAAPTAAVLQASTPVAAPVISAVPSAPSAATSQPAVPMVANAPTSALPQEVRGEVAASPTPRPMPSVQPSLLVPPPPAAASITAEITDIRPVMIPSVADPGAVSASANQPAQPDAKAPAADLHSTIAQLEAVLEQQPPHPQDELRLRLLYLAAGMDEKSVAPVKGMDPIQSELLNAIVKAVAASREAMLQPMQASSTALTATDELRRLLGQQSGVSIPRVALVTKVSSYGDYEQINPLRFKAGTEIHAYVYTEVANYRSEPTDGERLRTLLAERVQVFDATGKVIWERYEENIEDRVRTPRRDFFIPFPLKLPATLAPGDYVVKVTIEDRIGGTTDQQRLSFSIQ